MAVIRLRDLYLDSSSRSLSRPWHGVSDDCVKIDLSEEGSEVSNPSSLRLDMLQLALLANFISSAFADRRMDFQLPITPAVMRMLARTPILSAIAHHPQVARGDLLSEWRTKWDPTDSRQDMELLHPDQLAIGPAQPGLLSLMNPHDRPASRVAVEVRGLVDPWLNSRYIPAANSPDQERSLRDLERVMSELTENVADHAFPETSQRAPFSMAQIYSTRGGRGSMNRFFISVSDNGCGIPFAVRRARHDLNGLSAVNAVFEGRLRHGSGRGFGLQNVAKIVQRNAGSHFTLLTSHLEDRNRAIGHVVTSDGASSEELHGLPIRGTIAFAMLPLPLTATDGPTLFDAGDHEHELAAL